VLVKQCGYRALGLRGQLLYEWSVKEMMVVPEEKREPT
jgi:hypothetical protein